MLQQSDFSGVRKFLLVLPAVVLCFSIAWAQDTDFPWLKDLKTGDEVRASGQRLVALALGLHALEEIDADNKRIVIGVHGWSSEGYEWVYPLQTMDSEQTTTYFFRWDYNQCPLVSGELLLEAIPEVLEAHHNAESLLVVGHSLGGVLVASIADGFDFAVETELHMIAAPLTGVEHERCPDQRLPTRLIPQRDLYEWRTQHELDNAFNRMEEDPQNVEMRDSLVVRLPDTYNGRRLGHNWSISWVAEKLTEP